MDTMGMINARAARVEASDGVYDVLAVPLAPGKWSFKVSQGGRCLRPASAKHQYKAAGLAVMRGKRWVTGERSLREKG
jgi:hypothetical protein